MLASERMLELVEVAPGGGAGLLPGQPGLLPGTAASSRSANDKEAALDLEAKILENGHLVYKQVREFGGR